MLADLHSTLEENLRPAAATEDDDEKAQIIVRAFLVLSPFFKM